MDPKTLSKPYEVDFFASSGQSVPSKLWMILGTLPSGVLGFGNT